MRCCADNGPAARARARRRLAARIVDGAITGDGGFEVGAGLLVLPEAFASLPQLQLRGRNQAGGLVHLSLLQGRRGVLRGTLGVITAAGDTRRGEFHARITASAGKALQLIERLLRLRHAAGGKLSGQAVEAIFRIGRFQAHQFLPRLGGCHAVRA